MENKPAVSLGNFLKMPNTNDFLQKQLGSKKSQFVSNLISLSQNSKALSKCDPSELMKCAMNATSLDLSLNPNLGHAYVIPYENKRTNVVVPNFQLGYKGYIQLAIRTGQYKKLNACEVREGEIRYNKFTGAFEVLGEYPDNEIVGYLAFLELKTGFEASLYMSEANAEKHARKYSQAYKYDIQYKKRTSVWSDPDERPKMAIKTVLKGLLSKYGLITTELDDAMSREGEEIHDVPKEDYTVSNTSGEYTEPEKTTENETVNIDDLRGEK